MTSTENDTASEAADPLADVKVGDSAPTECLDDEPPCALVGHLFMCCRTRGHVGQHIATTDDEVLEVWP